MINIFEGAHGVGKTYCLQQLAGQVAPNMLVKLSGIKPGDLSPTDRFKFMKEYHDSVADFVVKHLNNCKKNGIFFPIIMDRCPLSECVVYGDKGGKDYPEKFFTEVVIPFFDAIKEFKPNFFYVKCLDKELLKERLAKRGSVNSFELDAQWSIDQAKVYEGYIKRLGDRINLIEIDNAKNKGLSLDLFTPVLRQVEKPLEPYIPSMGG